MNLGRDRRPLTWKRFFCTLFLLPLASQATSILNPESKHEQFTSYGLFFEPQSMLVFLSGARGWGAVGGAAPLFEVTSQSWRPQYFLHASANVSYDMNYKNGVLYTETIDARVGLGADMTFSREFRGNIVWTHQSGHIADNVPDPSLIGPDLGNEMLSFRLIRDFDRHWRIGGSLRPFLITNPPIASFGADQFIEYFPMGARETAHELSPFLALGLEEYGAETPELTAHFQCGWAAGSHFSDLNRGSLRFVMGAYSGQDPRLKYFQYERHKSRFIYAGVMFEI